MNMRRKFLQAGSADYFGSAWCRRLLEVPNYARIRLSELTSREFHSAITTAGTMKAIQEMRR